MLITSVQKEKDSIPLRLPRMDATSNNVIYKMKHNEKTIVVCVFAILGFVVAGCTDAGLTAPDQPTTVNAESDWRSGMSSEEKLAYYKGTFSFGKVPPEEECQDWTEAFGEGDAVGTYSETCVSWVDRGRFRVS